MRYVDVLQESKPFLWFAMELNVDMPNQGIKKGKKFVCLFFKWIGLKAVGIIVVMLNFCQELKSLPRPAMS